MDNLEADNAEEQTPQRRIGKNITVCGIGFALFVILLPTIVSHTGLRNILLAQALPDEFHASCDRASIGWFSPLDARGITVKDAEGRWTIEAKGASNEKTLLQIITNFSKLGEIEIVNPTLTINIDAWAEAAPQAPIEKPSSGGGDISVRVTITDATIQTITDDSNEPDVVANKVNITADFQRHEGYELLVIPPGKPLDHATLSPEMCRSLMKYVAPIVANTAWTDGAVSLELDQCSLPLGNVQDAKASGVITIHAVNVGVREGVGQQVTQLVASLTQKDIPTKVRLADDSRLEFAVNNGVVTHKGLKFGLPEISDELVVETHGVVRFDKSLDLEASIPVPYHLLGGGKLAQAIGIETFHVPIRGTLDEPEVQFDMQSHIARVFGKISTSGALDEYSISDILNGVKELRDQRKADRALFNQTPPDREQQQGEAEDASRRGLLERLRQRRQAILRGNNEQDK
ncbi:MAG: hypothetical protein KDB27_11970 [Planctomycetales bacterium]|nr:hypothetical protein [Planctomycetales bacterium]